MSRRESEEIGLAELRQRAILDALPAYVSLLDAEGTIVSVNEAWRRFAQDNVLQGAAVGVGENYLAVCDRATGPSSAEAHAVAAGIRAVLGGSLPMFSLEYPCHAPDRSRWFRLTVTPLEQGHGAVNMHVDITNERLTEQALAEREEELQQLVAKEKAAAEQIAESEERFRLLAKATNDAVWDWDLIDESLWWNEGFTTLFGFVRQDSGATIVSWTTRLHPEDRHAVVSSLRAAISSDVSTWSSEYRFLRQDGAYAYVLNRGHIIRDDGGKGMRMIGGMTDLTDRKRFEERLLEQATLLDKAHDAIMVRSLTHHILYWNQSAERLYGWPAAEAMGHAITDIIHADPLAFAAAHGAMHATGEWRGELEKRTKDGRTLIIEGHWTLVRDDHGRPKSVLVIDTDITARKDLEAQFLRAQRMESVGALAGGIAHDLTNALTPILVTVSALREERGDAALSEDLALIESCALRGSDMVRQLLSFARGSEGRRHKIDMVVLVEELRKIVRDTFPKNIKFHTNATGQPCQVNADATQIHQLLTNLFVNARDAMPHGGNLSR